MLEKEKPETGQIGDEILLTGAAREAYLNAPTEAPGANEGASEATCESCGAALSLHSWEGARRGVIGQRVCPAPPISLQPVEVEPRKDVKPDLTSEPRKWTRAEAEKALDMRPALEAAPTVTKLSEWLEHSRASGNLHVAIPCDRVEEILELLTKNSPAAPDGPSVLTPAVHSTLLEMIGFADAGRCMACGGPLWSPSQSGCHGEHSHGGCVVKFAERHPEHLRWKQRMNVLQLARKYARGEFNR
jgi:hypothetical protein